MRIAWLLGLFFCALSLHAYEIDPYTYYHVPLRDIGPFLNEEINRDVLAIVNDANARIAANGPNTSDRDAEYFLAKAYQKHAGNPYLNKWEGCILANDCPGWPSIERIMLLPEESVFWEADYNYVTKYFLAPTVQACGVRIGSDKLAHMMMLGFRLYNMWMLERNQLDDKKIYALNVEEENSVQGRVVGEIASFGDIEANIQGLRFFRDLFWRSQYLDRDNTTGFIHQVRQVDLCDYINPKWDEVKNPSKFTGKRRAALRNAIAKRASSGKDMSEQERQEIFARKSKYSGKNLKLRAYILQRQLKRLLSKGSYEYLVQLNRVITRVPASGRKEARFLWRAHPNGRRGFAKDADALEEK